MRLIARVVVGAFIALAPSAVNAAPPKPPPAQPTLIARITAESFAELLKDAGYRAELRRGEKSGEGYIFTGIGGRKASVVFYACKPEGCRSLQYRLSFSKSPKLTMKLVNEWNKQKRYAKAYIDDDGDLMLEWDFDLGEGVTPAYLRGSVEKFEELIAEFDKFLP